MTKPQPTLFEGLTALRAAFERALTVDSDHRDRRRKDYNQAIFAPAEDGGYAIWTSTDLDMVMGAFDHAVRMRVAQEGVGLA